MPEQAPSGWSLSAVLLSVGVGRIRRGGEVVASGEPERSVRSFAGFVVAIGCHKARSESGSQSRRYRKTEWPPSVGIAHLGPDQTETESYSAGPYAGAGSRADIYESPHPANDVGHSCC